MIKYICSNYPSLNSTSFHNYYPTSDENHQTVAHKGYGFFSIFLTYSRFGGKVFVSGYNTKGIYHEKACFNITIVRICRR